MTDLCCLAYKSTTQPSTLEKAWEAEGSLLATLSSVPTSRSVPLGLKSSLSGPNLFGTRGQFHGRQFFHRQGSGGGFRMIQGHYIYYALYF